MTRLLLLGFLMAGCAVKKTPLVDQQTELDCHSLQSVVLGDLRAPMEEFLAKIEWSYPDDWEALDFVESQIHPSSTSADQVFLLAQIKIIRANHPKTPFWKKPGMVKQGLADLNRAIDKNPMNRLFRWKRLEFQIFLPNSLRDPQMIEKDIHFFSNLEADDVLCDRLIVMLTHIWRHSAPPPDLQEQGDPNHTRYFLYKHMQYQELWSNR